MDPCTLLVVGMVAGGAAVVTKAYHALTTTRTINTIRRTEAKTLSDMRTISRQFTTHVDRQTRPYRRSM